MIRNQSESGAFFLTHVFLQPSGVIRPILVKRPAS